VGSEEEEVDSANVVEEQELGPWRLEVLISMKLYTYASEPERDLTPDADQDLKVSAGPSTEAEHEQGDETRSEERPEHDDWRNEHPTQRAARRRGREAGGGHLRLRRVLRVVQVIVQVFRGSCGAEMLSVRR
jgi:hypothetical protein